MDSFWWLFKYNVYIYTWVYIVSLIFRCLKWWFTISEKLEGALTAASFYNWYLFYISPRCLEPVRLTKKWAQNRIMSFGTANSWFFLNRLFLSIKYYINKYLARLCIIVFCKRLNIQQILVSLQSLFNCNLLSNKT